MGRHPELVAGLAVEVGHLVVGLPGVDLVAGGRLPGPVHLLEVHRVGGHVTVRLLGRRPTERDSGLVTNSTLFCVGPL